METENIDMMEDGEVDETNEVDFKRERKVSESIRNSFSSLDEEKLKKRAERFGIDPDSTKVAPVTKEQMKELYESLEIPDEEIKNILESDMSEPGTHVLNHRFEAIHLRGTEDMNTQNVFDYFKGYAPASIEWINDYSCNVVWLEPWQAARAILERSSRNVVVQPTKSNVEGEAMDHEESVSEPALPIPTPPGIWRLGFEYQYAKALIMRFATRADRKIKGAERLSHYYRNHGNPNYGGLAGLISSSRKRRFHGKPDPTEQVDSKNPWGSLAEAWGASEPAEPWEASEPAENWERRPEGKRPIGTGLPSALVRRLGHQPPRPSPSRSRDTESDASDSWDTTDSESGSCSSQSSNQEVGRSKKKRIRMRMYADEEEERSRRKNLHARLADPHPEKNGLSGKARTSRPVHTRLGPNVDVLPAAMPISTRSDLRQRLGSSAPKSPVDSVLLRGTLISADQEGPHLENAKIDLRSKLQSRLGSK
ncbi:nuclear cap-binding protein subunit 3-like [Daphnia pulicaria]|uniref:nuclear cap-binding protein subunit 3-like n=1 Tax=Daphnia pulicaria TaxID=35523 RepID=UPI001EEA9912|nr:nuclear cap-binding protein subunit 3-like [Daphnia pulicaria]